MANKSTQEDEVFEFLNSLPEQGGKGTGAAGANAGVSAADALTAQQEGKTDQEILDFLDELEATKEQPKTAAGAAGAASGASGASMPAAADGASAKVPAKKQAAPAAQAAAQTAQTAAVPSMTSSKPETAQKSAPDAGAEVNDPITSFSNWWSREGSAKVSSGISSLWGTAQSVSEQAQKKAEEAIKKAREQGGIEENLKSAFKDLGITGVLEGDRELSAKEIQQLMAMPDTKQAMDSFNKGLGIFSAQVNSVIEKLNSKDEVLDIKIVHDLTNYPSLSGSVKQNFEHVMNSQVDGKIQVKVEQSGTQLGGPSPGKRSLALFQGKISDADRLVQANVESIMQAAKPAGTAVTAGAAEATTTTTGQPEPEFPAVTPARRTNIYIGLLAVSVSKEDVTAAGATVSPAESSIVIDEYQASSFCFTATLIDKTHDITITTRSQPFPLKWCRWLDGDYTPAEKSSEGEDDVDEEIDPASWVIDWVETALDSTFGVMAQEYTILRMGY